LTHFRRYGDFRRELKIGASIAYHMTRNTVGWIVRTESAGHHRYWKVGTPDADRAAVIARKAAGADTATSVTPISSHARSAYTVSPSVATEVIWESRPVADLSGPCGPEAQAGAEEKMLGEITFDIVVPTEGVNNVEGCYRINGGNWQVYYLTNWRHRASPTSAAIIESNALFQSGISGVSGVVPGDWTLNKRRIKEILAEAVGVDGWIEVTGPNSQILK
jgi:hypothetical protein